MCEMKAILRTSDPVLVSFVGALLAEAGIGFLIADASMSALEGGIGAFPRRVLVADAHVAGARTLLGDAGLAHELIEDEQPAGFDPWPIPRRG